MLLLSSADFFSKLTFSKNSFRNPIRIWTQIWINILLVLIWVLTVCKDFQQTTKRKVSHIITGGTNILDWLIVNDNIRDYYIPCTLSDTDINSEPRVPVYYVSLKVKNGAGDYSPPQVSTPVIVVPEDVTGGNLISHVLYFCCVVFLKINP